MTGLVRAELRRAFSRRLFALLGALAVLGLLVTVVITFIRSSNDPNSGLDQARRDVAACQQESQRAPDGEVHGEQFQCPQIDEVRQFYDKRFRYASTMVDVSRGIAVALFVVSFLIGASFVGAEWGTGAITTLLTWEPRRLRVLIAKTVAIVTVLAAAAALFLALLAVIFVPVAQIRGVTDGMSSSMWWTLAGIWSRGAGLAGFGAAVGAGLATFTRNTAGAMGIGSVYGIIVDPLLGVQMEGRLRPWLLQDNFLRLLGLPVEVPDPSLSHEGVIAGTTKVLSATRPLVLLTLYALGVLAVAYASFRARDVT